MQNRKLFGLLWERDDKIEEANVCVFQGAALHMRQCWSLDVKADLFNGIPMMLVIGIPMKLVIGGRPA